MDPQQVGSDLQVKYNAYRQGKQELEKINNNIKQQKANLDAYEKDIIHTMINVFNKAWIDESGQGAGPYIVVDQCATEPALKDQDFIRLFTSFLESIRNNERITPDIMLTRYKEERKKGEKRTLRLVTRVRRPEGDGSANGLLDWQAFREMK